MPKYDAFGREIGEDTLEGLGGSPSERPDWRDEAYAAKPAEPQPAEPETGWTENAPPADEAQRRQLAGQLSTVLQQAAATGPRTVTVRRSGSGRGCLIALVVLLVIGAGVALAVVSLVSTVKDNVATIDKIKLPTIERPQSGPQPKGLERGSMMRRAAFADVLREIRADESVKLKGLHLTPARISGQLLTRDGRIRNVAVTPGGKLERVGPDSGPGFDSISTIPIARIDPGAPQRLARRGAREHGIPITELQYAVPQDISGQVRWVVYFTRARYVIGDARGRFERAYN